MLMSSVRSLKWISEKSQNRETVCLVFFYMVSREWVGVEIKALRLKGKKAHISWFYICTHTCTICAHTHTHTEDWVNLAQHSVFFKCHPRQFHAMETAGFVSCSSPVKTQGVSTSCPLCVFVDLSLYKPNPSTRLPLGPSNLNHSPFRLATVKIQERRQDFPPFFSVLGFCDSLSLAPTLVTETV